VPARVGGTEYPSILEAGITPRLTVDELKARGITPESPVPGSLPAALIAVEEEDGTHYWLAFNNFYAITRYNRSVNYAMAVFLLGREVATAHQQTARAPVQAPTDHG
jgi:membrane-bound lytic murein transglycosylase B